MSEASSELDRLAALASATPGRTFGSQMQRAVLFPIRVYAVGVVLALEFVLVFDRGSHRADCSRGFTDSSTAGSKPRKIGEPAGALLDPLADRIFVFVAISTYLVEGLLTTGQYFVFLTRDLATAAGFIVAKIIPTLRPAVFRARMLGKIVTVIQLITLVTIIVLPETTRFRWVTSTTRESDNTAGR